MSSSHREKRKHEVKGGWGALPSTTYKLDWSPPTCSNLHLVSQNEGSFLFFQASPSFSACLRDLAQFNPSLTWIFSPPFPISSVHTHAQISLVLNKFSVDCKSYSYSFQWTLLKELSAFIVPTSSPPIDFSPWCKLLSALIALPKPISVRSQMTSIYPVWYCWLLPPFCHPVFSWLHMVTLK